MGEKLRPDEIDRFVQSVLNAEPSEPFNGVQIGYTFMYPNPDLTPQEVTQQARIIRSIMLHLN